MMNDPRMINQGVIQWITLMLPMAADLKLTDEAAILRGIRERQGRSAYQILVTGELDTGRHALAKMLQSSFAGMDIELISESSYHSTVEACNSYFAGKSGVDLVIFVLSCERLGSLSESLSAKAIYETGILSVLFVCENFDRVDPGERENIRLYALAKFSKLTDFHDEGVLFMEGDQLPVLIYIQRLMQRRDELRKMMDLIQTQRVIKRLLGAISGREQELRLTQNKVEMQFREINQSRFKPKSEDSAISMRLHNVLKIIRELIRGKTVELTERISHRIPEWLETYDLGVPVGSLGLKGAEGDAIRTRTVERTIEYLEEKTWDELQGWMEQDFAACLERLYEEMEISFPEQDLTALQWLGDRVTLPTKDYGALAIEGLKGWKEGSKGTPSGPYFLTLAGLAGLGWFLKPGLLLGLISGGLAITSLAISIIQYFSTYEKGQVNSPASQEKSYKQAIATIVTEYVKTQLPAVLEITANKVIDQARDSIAASLSQITSENHQAFQCRAEELSSQLSELEQELHQIADSTETLKNIERQLA